MSIYIYIYSPCPAAAAGLNSYHHHPSPLPNDITSEKTQLSGLLFQSDDERELVGWSSGA